MSEILNLKCAVRAPGNIPAATLDDAIARAIQLFELVDASRARYRYVFPIPPGQSTKNIPPSFANIFTKIKLNALSC